jgi:alpha-methylacyl-CoA racemase
MMLADIGAEVVTPIASARKNLKSVAGAAEVVELDRRTSRNRAVLDLLAGADALIEGFRPGVMERLASDPTW